MRKSNRQKSLSGFRPISQIQSSSIHVFHVQPIFLVHLQPQFSAVWKLTVKTHFCDFSYNELNYQVSILMDHWRIWKVRNALKCSKGGRNWAWNETIDKNDWGENVVYSFVWEFGSLRFVASSHSFFTS